MSEGVSGWLNQHPEVITLMVIAAGWLTALVVRRVLAASIVRLNRSSARWTSRAGPILTPRFTRVLLMFLFWGILLASVILGFSFLGDGIFSSRVDALWAFVSRLLVALFILAAGHVLGLFARSLLTGLARKTDVAGLSRVVYAVILGIALVTAIDHLGLNVSFISQVGLVLIAVFFAGLALAFALGARTQVSNLMAQGELFRYKVGDRIRIEDAEGTVVELHRTGLVLSTDEGFARIPASKFAEHNVVVLHSESAEDG